jgi:hypothetical protein
LEGPHRGLYGVQRTVRYVLALAAALIHATACQRSPEAHTDPSASAPATQPAPDLASTGKAVQGNVASEFGLLKVDGPARSNWLDDCASMTARVETCWSRRRPKGTGSLGVSISSPGTVESVRIDGPLEDSERTCALEAARTFKFAPGDGRMTIELAIRF